jgi:hypothetical protein
MVMVLCFSYCVVRTPTDPGAFASDVGSFWMCIYTHKYIALSCTLLADVLLMRCL